MLMHKVMSNFVSMSPYTQKMVVTCSANMCEGAMRLISDQWVSLVGKESRKVTRGKMMKAQRLIPTALIHLLFFS